MPSPVVTSNDHKWFTAGQHHAVEHAVTDGKSSCGMPSIACNDTARVAHDEYLPTVDTERRHFTRSHGAGRAHPCQSHRRVTLRSASRELSRGTSRPAVGVGVMAAVTPARRPSSVRRTTTHDCTRRAAWTARSPSSHSGATCAPTRQAELSSTAARVDMQAQFPEGTIIEISSEPAHPRSRRGRGDRILRLSARGSRCHARRAGIGFGPLPAARRHSYRVDAQRAGAAPVRASRSARRELGTLAGRHLRGLGGRRRVAHRLHRIRPPLNVGPVVGTGRGRRRCRLARTRPAAPARDAAATPHRRLDRTRRRTARRVLRDSHADAERRRNRRTRYSLRAAFDATTHDIVASLFRAAPYPSVRAAAASATGSRDAGAEISVVGGRRSGRTGNVHASERRAEIAEAIATLVNSLG